MQSFKSYLLVFFLISFTSVQAKSFGLGLGAFFESASTYRGALTWPKPSLLGGPNITLFERISIAGPAISYNHFDRSSPYELEANFSIVNDDEPWISLGSHEEDYRNSRKGTYETSVRFGRNFGFMNKFHVGGLLLKDLKRSKGLYGELHLKAPLFIYTTFNYLLGLGEAQSNRYFYGDSGVSGPSWHEFSVKYVMPFVPWEGIVINTLSYSMILQDENKGAELVRNDDSHVVFRTIFIWNLL